MRSLTVIERPDDTFVYLGGHTEALTAFSSESRQLVHLVNVRNIINQIQSKNLRLVKLLQQLMHLI